MKIKENRSIMIFYCDYCKIEILGNFQTIYKKDKSELHFCNTPKKNEKHNCVVNWKKNQMLG